MKRSLLLSIVLLAFVANLSAQRYSINKYRYDYHQYIPEYDDPYNPAISGVCSFFIPGLGQIYCGETGRGFAFLGAYAGCTIICGIGLAQITANSYYYFNSDTGNIRNRNAGGGTILLGLGGMAAVSIWSIIDAINVAKVNDMYIRSLRNTSALKIEMSPYVDHISINNQTSTPLGMTMRIKF
jgi:TM2 domain-containing membrane protein YozV